MGMRMGMGSITVEVTLVAVVVEEVVQRQRAGREEGLLIALAGIGEQRMNEGEGMTER